MDGKQVVVYLTESIWPTFADKTTIRIVQRHRVRIAAANLVQQVLRNTKIRQSMTLTKRKNLIPNILLRGIVHDDLLMWVEDVLLHKLVLKFYQLCVVECHCNQV